MRDIFFKTLVREAQKDERIMLITGDLGFKVLDEFVKTLPQQFLNCGIAEQNMTGLAAGFALEGKIPLTYSIANFPTLRAMEQVRLDIAYHKLPVKLVSIGGGMSYGPLGASHHATEDIAIMRALPHMMVLTPADDWEVEQMTPQLLAHDGPVYLRLDKTSAGNTQQENEEFVLGKARIIKQGGDVTLISAGGILVEVLAAAEQLAQKGMSAQVISVHSVKPLDTETILEAARHTGKIITIEEHVTEGGLGGAVAEVLAEACVPMKQFTRLGLQNTFAHKVGSQEWLRKAYGIDAEAIIAAALH